MAYQPLWVLYTIPININRYVPFLMNMLDTIVRERLICWLSSTLLAVVYLLHATGEYCILIMLYSNSLMSTPQSSTLTITPWGLLLPHKKEQCPGYDAKTASDGEASFLEIWGGWSTLTLPLLPGPLWPRVVVLVRLPYMAEINLFKNYLYLIRILDTIFL